MSRVIYSRVRTHLAWLLTSVVSCMQVGTDTGNGGGGGTSASGSAASPSSAPAALPTGANCGLDPTGTVNLCEQISTCPGVDVDQGAFPNCGFRLGAAASLDIECVCGGVLCPIGVPQTCADATELLAGQTSLLVCEQASEGRCISLTAPDAGAASTCDTTCASYCSGAPDCLVLCGC